MPSNFSPFPSLRPVTARVFYFRAGRAPSHLLPFIPSLCVLCSVSCRGGEIPPCVFEAPPGYSMLGGKQRDSMREEEEDLLQFAIQQSLLEAGSEYDQVLRTHTHVYVLHATCGMAQWMISV